MGKQPTFGRIRALHICCYSYKALNEELGESPRAPGLQLPNWGESNDWGDQHVRWEQESSASPRIWRFPHPRAVLAAHGCAPVLPR